jgi:hypothetical protein
VGETFPAVDASPVEELEASVEVAEAFPAVDAVVASAVAELEESVVAAFPVEELEESVVVASAVGAKPEESPLAASAVVP